MSNKLLLIITILAICFMSCAKKSETFSTQKNITGMYAGVTPYEVEIIDDNGTEFAGIMKWPSYKTWIYVEGNYPTSDSIVIVEKHYILNEIFQNQLGEFKIKVTDNSIDGLSTKRTKIFGVLKEEPRNLTKFESCAWKMIQKEVASRDEILKLNDDILGYYRKQNDLKEEDAEKLQIKVAELALPIAKNGLEFTKKMTDKTDENSSIDAEVLQKEFKTRLGLLTRFADYDAETLAKFQEILNDMETNFPGYFVLSEKLFNSKMGDKYKDADYNDKEVISQYRADQKEFYIEFTKKELFYEDMVPFIFSFAYNVLEENIEYQEYLWGEIIKLETNEKLDLGPQLDRMKSTVQAIITAAKMTDQPTPELISNTLNGEEFKLSNQKGKVVFLEYWATWCGPCKKVTPRLKEIYAKYKDNNDFVMVSVALDKLDAVKDYVEEHEMTWIQIVPDTDPWKSALAADYAITGVPTAFLIDKDGILRERLHPGDVDLENKLAELLK